MRSSYSNPVFKTESLKVRRSSLLNNAIISVQIGSGSDCHFAGTQILTRPKKVKANGLCHRLYSIDKGGVE